MAYLFLLLFAVSLVKSAYPATPAGPFPRSAQWSPKTYDVEGPWGWQSSIGRYKVNQSSSEGDGKPRVHVTLAPGALSVAGVTPSNSCRLHVEPGDSFLPPSIDSLSGEILRGKLDSLWLIGYPTCGPEFRLRSPLIRSLQLFLSLLNNNRGCPNTLGMAGINPITIFSGRLARIPAEHHYALHAILPRRHVDGNH